MKRATPPTGTENKKRKPAKVGRPSSGQAPLRPEQILTVALRLVDEIGVEALTMRRLAAELRVDPMAIYHHLPGKPAVLAGMTEMVFAGLRVKRLDNEKHWQEQIRAFAEAYRKLTRAHPNLVLHLIGNPDSAPVAVLAANEILYTALASAGLSSQGIVTAADLIVDYLHGYALADHKGRLENSFGREALVERLDELPPEKFPTMRMVLHFVENRGFKSDVQTGLDVIIMGIESFAKTTGRRAVRS